MLNHAHSRLSPTLKTIRRRRANRRSPHVAPFPRMRQAMVCARSTCLHALLRMLLLIGFGTMVLPFNTGADELSATNLATLPLEKLMDLEVTTSARHPETLAQTPAAISVITQDDIHR